MLRDTYQVPQGIQEETTAPGHYKRPDFELNQQIQLNQNQGFLRDRDFEHAVMRDEARLAADNKWDLEEQQRLDTKMFDRMNDERPPVRNQVAEVHDSSETPTFVVTREQVAGWSVETKISRNGQISKAIVAMRNKELAG